MKKRVFLSLALLTIATTSMVFAQTINGLWRTASGNVASIYDGKAVMTEINTRDWKEAEKRGNIGIGVQSHRNIRSTGNLTWTGQYLGMNLSTYAVNWAGNVTFKMNSNGQTMQVQVQDGTGSGTWTKIK